MSRPHLLILRPIPLILLVLFLASASGITLEQGLQNPKKYIFYDRSEFNVGANAGLALLVTMSILITMVGTVNGIAKACDSRRRRRMKNV
ncbi:unnamed protein product [Schistocephalus solidus]|uniref:ResB domain-containing protein n=1 Tax=Schistocephalus solidus TaxID=70667 RepID=A0A183SCT1_SCHSO|nr:unnamed protein product [Schistocephalus solidus]